MSGNSTEDGDRRVDARRNRDRILAAARAAFADPAADVSMAEIARRAGVGSATLYRNYPSRRDLLEAVYSEEITAISDAAATSEGTSDLLRLQSWLRRFYDYISSKRVLAGELLEHTDSESPVFTNGYEKVRAAAGLLVDAAHASGELRADLTLEQILALVASVSSIGGDAAYRQPVLDTALDGLHART